MQVQKKKISDGNIPVSVKLSDLILDEIRNLLFGEKEEARDLRSLGSAAWNDIGYVLSSEQSEQDQIVFVDFL